MTDHPLDFTLAETGLVEEYLTHEAFLNSGNENFSNRQTMLEWGVGGSTFCFSRHVYKYYAIEHDYDWYNKVCKELLKRDTSNVMLNFALPNDREAYDYNIDVPIFNNEKGKDIFKHYINYCTNFPFAFDFVLIDGRARKHCAFKIHPLLKPESLVFFHDFNNRPYYHDILKEKYKIVEKQDSLAVLSPIKQ
jgi:hypothetical protein